jgi:hypothetical protein
VSLERTQAAAGGSVPDLDRLVPTPGRQGRTPGSRIPCDGEYVAGVSLERTEAGAGGGRSVSHGIRPPGKGL